MRLVDAEKVLCRFRIVAPEEKVCLQIQLVNGHGEGSDVAVKESEVCKPQLAPKDTRKGEAAGRRSRSKQLRSPRCQRDMVYGLYSTIIILVVTTVAYKLYMCGHDSIPTVGVYVTRVKKKPASPLSCSVTATAIP